MKKDKRQKLKAAGWSVGSARDFLATSPTSPMTAPSRFTEHALQRFIERWGPMPAAEDTLHMATVTRAYHVETVPGENQSIWGFVVLDGPHKGETALMVVSADGTVRTVLPSGSKRPAARRRKRPTKATKQGKRR